MPSNPRLFTTVPSPMPTPASSLATTAPDSPPPAAAASEVLPPAEPTPTASDDSGEVQAELRKKKLTTIAESVGLVLRSYDVHGEDDGASGGGVDLYLGYVTASLVGRGSGTTPVTLRLTNHNGNQRAPSDGAAPQPRTYHAINQAVCSIDIPAAGVAATRVCLIEADGSTPLVKEAFANAASANCAPSICEGDILQIKPVEVRISCSPLYDPLINLLRASDTDDNYGHWTLGFSFVDGRLMCSVLEVGDYCFPTANLVELLPGTETSLTVRYVDDENDIAVELGLQRAAVPVPRDLSAVQFARAVSG